MIHFSFMDYLKYSSFYNTLVTIKSTKPEWLNYHFYLDFIYTNFPFSFWNGGLNSCQNTSIMTRDDFILFKNYIKIPFCLDFSNCMLKEEDFYDPHIKAILEEYQNQQHSIRIADINIMNIIKNNYHDYNFVITDVINNFIDFSEEDNLLQEVSLFNPNIENISHKSNKIISLGSPCSNCDMHNYLNCTQNEQLLSYNFYGDSTMQKCFDNNKISAYKLHQQLLNYQEMGYTRFKIMTTNYQTLFQFLIKPIHYFDFLNAMEDIGEFVYDR